MSDDVNARRRARAAWPSRVIERSADADGFDRETWRAMSGAERVAWAWALTVSQWEMKGVREDQLGVRRTVASVQRRER